MDIIRANLLLIITVVIVYICTPFLQVVFFRGVSSNIRKEVWPFLLGIFSWKSTTQERHQTMEELIRDYKVLLAKK